MKRASVSKFKAQLAEHLRVVESGETIVITDHKRPVAEVRSVSPEHTVYEPAERPFSCRTLNPVESAPGLWKQLIDEDRGGR